ncbi:ESCRT-0 subunit protein HSE1 LALA0_S02e02168g [Lachancea lanzarotensis]|uniref:Class E vacuolar protein-sorting machinery protein HSE1 n=1 Tax=Lachancea lanzarotensis TaxID=1245769 RepID=A0A0C7N2V8_9SACH|nr:uncharacterized protein LALA0_S02e02168g [Lachancea lanzarotensis]CEP60897.1 LALA0S02e02168g1_1 [Lachancea lanzarotensis]
MVSTNVLRTAILKATDGKLRADNWQYILEVCDLVKEDPEDGGRAAVEIVQERLKVTDANVVLRTLSLVVSLAENCGSRLQQAISSKVFTKELFNLITSSNVHWEVKKEVAKTIAQLSDSFQRDPSLRGMQDLYSKVEAQTPTLLQENGVPRKTEMADNTKRDEEKELEEALRLSTLEYEKASKSPNGLQQNTPDAVRPVSPNNGHISSTTGVRKVRALHNLTGRDTEELSFRKGDTIAVIEQVYRDWWRGSLRGRIGIFPLNYVTPVVEKTPQEVDQARAEEGYVLNAVSDVDRLHLLLKDSGQNVQIMQDQQVTDLYSSVTPLRPQVTKMLGSVAQKKEEYSSLRKVLADAESSYNQLLSRASQAYTSPSAQNLQPEYSRAPQQYENSQTVATNRYVHSQPFLTGEAPQPPRQNYPVSSQYQQYQASHQPRLPQQPQQQHQQQQNRYQYSHGPSGPPSHPHPNTQHAFGQQVREHNSGSNRSYNDPAL